MSGTDGLNGREESWIEWSGGECPVDESVKVDVRFRDGEVDLRTSAGFWAAGSCNWWKWESDDGDDDLNIIAYRIHKES